jgi:hypothetical protein
LFNKDLDRDRAEANMQPDNDDNVLPKDIVMSDILTAVSGKDLHYKMKGARSEKGWDKFIGPLRATYLLAAVSISVYPLEEVMYTFFRFQSQETYLRNPVSIGSSYHTVSSHQQHDVFLS